jgi:hypothetical protein
MPKADNEPVTWGEMRRIYKKLDARIDEAFAAAAAVDDKQAGFWDEHEDKISRQRRGMTRLEKRIKQLEEE